jgi:AcrR family transcriptional regulator
MAQGATVGGSRPVSAFAKLKPIRGLPREAVKHHQRARLYAAMIESAAEHGYAATKVRGLRTRAGVSERTLYDEFGGKEALFLATFDLVVRRAIKRVNTAYRSKTDWTDQLRAALNAFAREVTDEPDAARLAIVQALGAGPASLARMEKASQVFERMIGSSFAAGPGKVILPPLVVKGIVGGIARVARLSLLNQQEYQLSLLGDELVDWMLTYHSTAAANLPYTPTRDRPRRATDRDLPIDDDPTDEDARLRLLKTAWAVVAHRGYPELTTIEITDRAGVPKKTFHEHFTDHESCFLAALEHHATAAMKHTAKASAACQDWTEGIQSGITALLDYLAANPTFARIAFIELFTVGPAGIRQSGKLTTQFSELLSARTPPPQRAPALVNCAIVGAIWEIAHHLVAHNATHRLPQITHQAAYLALAPLIGGEAATQRILTDKTPPAHTVGSPLQRHRRAREEHTQAAFPSV